MTILRSVALALLVAGCGKQEESSAPAPDAATDVTAEVRPDAPVGVVDVVKSLDSCRAFNHRCTATDDLTCGQCQYRIRFDGERCSPEAPCDDLVLFWAFMVCDGPKMQELLDRLRKDHPRFVTACVQPLYPGEMLPLSLGAPERENEVVSALFSALRSGPTGVWTGKNLLMTGCSHGASRYPVVAARYPDDGKWMGTQKTAACMSEGGVSIPLQDQFIGQMLGSGGPSCPFRHRRMIEAYTSSTVTAAHACSASPGGQCACDPAHASLPYPGDCADGDCVAFDSIVRLSGSEFVLSDGVTPADFAIKDWRLVSEGSSFRDTPQRCERDVVPEGPYKALCSALAAAPGHSCSFVSFPDADHCSTYLQDIGPLCADWFSTLP